MLCAAGLFIHQKLADLQHLGLVKYVYTKYCPIFLGKKKSLIAFSLIADAIQYKPDKLSQVRYCNKEWIEKIKILLKQAFVC